MERKTYGITNDAFIADGQDVYGFDSDGTRLFIASAESNTWAEVIAQALANDPDIYIV